VRRIPVASVTKHRDHPQAAAIGVRWWSGAPLDTARHRPLPGSLSNTGAPGIAANREFTGSRNFTHVSPSFAPASRLHRPMSRGLARAQMSAGAGSAEECPYGAGVPPVLLV
jgi:hypothetical protein